MLTTRSSKITLKLQRAERAKKRVTFKKMARKGMTICLTKKLENNSIKVIQYIF